MNISGPAAVAKPEMLFYAPGDLTVTLHHFATAIAFLYDIELSLEVLPFSHTASHSSK